MLTERIQIDLSIAAGDATLTVPGGHVKACRVEARSWGFSAEVTFLAPGIESLGDAYFDAFQTHDLMTVTMTVKGALNQPTVPPDPLVLKGVATTRSLVETTFAQAGSAVYVRTYRIAFADAAQVLWRQHRPCDLMVDATWKDLLLAHKPEALTLTCDWQPLDATRPLICVGLGKDDGPATFYDFVCWLARTRGGLLSHDYAAHGLKLLGAKPTASGLPSFIVADEVQRLETSFPAPSRAAAAIQNASATIAAKTDVEVATAIAPARRDILARIPIQAEVDARKAVEEARVTVRAPEVTVHHKSYPTTCIRPGTIVRFEKGTWSLKLLQQGRAWRIRDVDLRLDAVDPSPATDLSQPSTSYTGELAVRCEEDAERWGDLPPHVDPVWPIHAEGKVVSAGGESDKTYQLAEDEKAGRSNLTVNVPLWNKDVAVPFLPDQLTGAFYFPPYKKSRVLLELQFDGATLDRTLDWGERTALPLESQGNHLLLGKNATSETSIRHAYVDAKPGLYVKRVSGKDFQRIEATEGLMVIEVKEDASAQAADETFSVKLQVETAKGELKTGVTGGISEVTGKFTVASAAVSGAIADATGEVSSALRDMGAAVDEKIDATKGELASAKSDLAAGPAALSAAGAAAVAEIQGLAQ